jgi:tetratricopeptide (TPR) repeat protein
MRKGSAVFFVLLLFGPIGCNRAERGTSPVSQADQGPTQPASPSPDLPGHAGETGAAEGAMPPVMQKISEYRERLEKDSKDLEALIFLGNANYDIQRYEKAQEYYQRALAVDRANTHIRTDLASAYRQTGEIDRAIEELRAVLAQDPNQEIALYNLGIILLNDKEDRDGAAKVWRKLVAIYRAKEAKYASLSGPKRAFLKAFGSANLRLEGKGKVDIGEVAQASGISAAEYHRWLAEDPLFSEALNGAKDSVIADELEKKILELESGKPLKKEPG